MQWTDRGPQTAADRRPKVENPGKLLLARSDALYYERLWHYTASACCDLYFYHGVSQVCREPCLCRHLIDDYILPLDEAERSGLFAVSHTPFYALPSSMASASIASLCIYTRIMVICHTGYLTAICATTCSPIWKSCPSGILTHTPMAILCQLIPMILIPCAR